jgi:hypothetical protein
MQALRLAQRIAREDEVHLEVFVLQQSRVTTLQDLEAMACFEAAVASKQ